jgi:formylglycine-generating enzyme required for sulfatase activity
MGVPVRRFLVGPLGVLFHDPRQAEPRQTAAIVLADYCQDDPDRLADLLLDADPRQLVARLEEEPDRSARRALILALGDYSGERLPAALRQPLTRKLLDWYEHDPDPGIHGAIDWLLRHGKEGPEDRPLDWGQAKELDRIEQALKRRDPDGKRGWYVNQQGQTLVLIPGPVQFRMGSPQDDPKRLAEERPHLVRIERSFAIASKAVTVEQYQRFLKDRPDVPQHYFTEFSPRPDCPINTVSWYAAAQYCNWLSAQEGIPESEWCYPKHADIKDGMKPYPDYLRRKGYRLATEAEWEYACRAGSGESRYYGSSSELLPRYAWFQKNAQDQMWPGGQKWPNDLGLFDMHGNAWTWVQDRPVAYPPSGVVKDIEDNKDLTGAEGRVLCGTSYTNRPLDVHCACRWSYPPSSRNSNLGLRVARTLP